MCDFERIFPEKGLHPLHPFCVGACNDDKHLVWVNFLYVSGSWEEVYVFFLLKTARAVLSPTYVIIQNNFGY